MCWGIETLQKNVRFEAHPLTFSNKEAEMKPSFRNLCAVFMTIAFVFFVSGSPSDVQAQSQEKLEKANSISNALIIGALVLVAVAVIVTVAKGDKKGKEDGEKNSPEEQNGRQNLERQVLLEPSSLSSRNFVLREPEAHEVKWRPDNETALPDRNAFLQQHDCLIFAYETE